MRDQETIEQACERIVRQEVLCCVSGLVSTLAKGYGDVSSALQLGELCEKAMELQSPVLDWEEAATQAGWSYDPVEDGITFKDQTINDSIFTPGHWQALCEECNIEPYEWEIFEHWAVSQWLADALIEQGERVDTDFEGLCVWARTTTGQGIAMDSVIRRVVEKLHADCAALTAKRA